MYRPTAVLVESFFERRKPPVEVASTLPILERLVPVASRLVRVTRKRGRKWLPVIVIALPGLTKGGFTVTFGAGVMLPASPAEARAAEDASRRAKSRRTPGVISARGGNGKTGGLSGEEGWAGKRRNGWTSGLQLRKSS